MENLENQVYRWKNQKWRKVLVGIGNGGIIFSNEIGYGFSAGAPRMARKPPSNEPMTAKHKRTQGGKQTFSVDLPPATLDEFLAFVEAGGYTKWRAVNASIQAFTWMPAPLRDLLMRGDAEAVKEYFRLLEWHYAAILIGRVPGQAAPDGSPAAKSETRKPA